MESKSRTYGCLRKKKGMSVPREEQDRQEIIQAKKNTRSTKRITFCHDQLVSSTSMIKKNPKMEFQNTRVNRKRTEYARKNLQSVQKKDIFMENPVDFVPEIKEEVIDPETESILELASCLHSHDNPAIVSSSTENLPFNMLESPILEDSVEYFDFLEAHESVLPTSVENAECFDFAETQQPESTTSEEIVQSSEVEKPSPTSVKNDEPYDYLSAVEPISSASEESTDYPDFIETQKHASEESRKITELAESHEYCSPDSTQLLDIVNPCAVNEEEEEYIVEEKPECLSCDTAVEIERLPFIFESAKIEVEASNNEANENLGAFEIEGECLFDVDGDETLVKKAVIEPSPESIGIIGCGPMAKAIICYLIKSRHIVFTYNRTIEKLMELPVNPIIVSSPAALVEKCDIVFACVSDATAVENIMEGPDGILEGLERHPDKSYVEMSSVDPKIISKYAEEVICRRGHYLTAQIGRTRPAAYLGCSLVTASGDKNTFIRSQSIFAAFSTNVVYVSADVEEAAVLNIINSVIEGVSIINLSDVLLSMEKLKIPRAFLLEMLEFQPAQISMLRVSAINMLENRDLVFIPVKHVVKNILMALEIKKSSYFGNEYLVTALQICKEILCHYPEALNHDISCVYKLRSDYSEEQ